MATEKQKLVPLKSWDDGLSADQKKAVGECIKTVAETTTATYRKLAEAFDTVKKALPERNWTKWTNDVELNIGARTIQDLAIGNQWLSSTSVSDEMIGKISARSIAMIAGADAKKQKQVEDRLKDGEVLSTSQVKIAIEGPANEKKAVESKRELLARIELLELHNQMRKQFTDEQVAAADKFREERDKAHAKIEELEAMLRAMTVAVNKDTMSSASRDAIGAVLKEKVEGMKVVTVNSKAVPAAAT